MSKLFKILTGMLLASLVLAACAPAATPTEEPIPEMSEMCMGAEPGATVTIMYQWSGAEEESLNNIFKPLLDECGIQIVAESTRDDAVLDTKAKSTPPDILFWPSTSPAKLYGAQLKDLSTVGANASSYGQGWIDGGTVDGKWSAIAVKADFKTVIWYSPAQFDANGYSVPTTLDELDALVEKMVADGNVPWSMGFESEAATGWTGSDFVQDLMLAQQGPAYVSGLLDGSIAYDDAGVVAAYEQYAKWASDPAYTVGGADGTVNTGFLDAIYKVFSDPPEAMMVKQSGFAGGEAAKQYPDLVYGTDYDFFEFPGAQGAQGGADFMMVFGDSPATHAMVAYLTSAEGATAWAQSGLGLSPNKQAVGNYADEVNGKLGELLANASGFTFDLGDGIGAPFNTAEWAALIEVVQGGDIAAALAPAAAAQKEALGQ
ncbi:MAG TPA: hypothetical protein VIS72_09810 [Anaerolineales bacterium]